LGNRFKNIIILAILSGIFMTACNPTKNLSDGQYLLVKNEIDFLGAKDKNVSKENMAQFIEQKPNVKLLGLIRLKMWIYKWAEKKSENGFNTWIKEKIGEPPAIFNHQMAMASASQMRGYLNNTGYFNSEASFKEEINKQKKTIKIKYNVRTRAPYIIENISFNIPDSTLSNTLFRYYTLQDIKTKRVFNAYTLENERDKITSILQNHGYYNFNKEYIFYEVDTNIGANQMNITLNINNIKVADKDKPGGYIFEKHKQYLFNKVFINTDYNPLTVNRVINDTLVVASPQYSDTTKKNHYYFIYNGKLKIKPSALIRAININSGDPFNVSDIQQTYKRLTEIKLFNYTNIQIEPDSLCVTSLNKPNSNFLNCNSLLSRSKVQSFTIEAEGTNTGGDLGVGGNLVYQNKNIFRGAELLTLKFSVAMEMQKLGNVEGANYDPNFLFFNTFETGSEVRLYFPRFLILIKKSFFSKNFKPKTTFSAGMNYQRRPNYTRYISNLSFGYDWSSSSKIKHMFFPFDLNIVKVLPTPEFDSILNSLTDARLKNQYSDHLVPGMKYSFIFNNQDINKLRNFSYFRFNLETTGNLLNGIDYIIKAPLNGDGYYTLFNIRYAQFIKLDLDYRYYIILDIQNRIALRTIVGIGLPYGNSEELPFEKGFYAGGANGMRAWRFRSLGPGSYLNSDTDFDRMGDFKIETNAEYRFPIYKFFKGALFADAGNIWLLKNNPSFPGGTFNINKFYDQIAVDLGLGFRFDFGFFLFRIDGAIPVRDPAQSPGNKWVFNKMRLERVVWNFGIGYPF